MSSPPIPLGLLLSKYPIKTGHQLIHYFCSDLKDAKYSTVGVANALWYNKKFSVKDSYLDLCEDFHSSAKKLTSEAVEDINK